jgi:hypothetical protein
MERIGRRELLIGAGAGTVALATLGIGVDATSAAADTGHEEAGGNTSLTGGWLITRTDTNGSARNVVALADGGAVVSRDIDPAGSPGFGTWASTGGHKFVATFYEGDVGPSGPSGPTSVLKVIVNGSWHGDQISGTYTFSVTVSGSVVASGTGSFTGTRIVAGQ